MPVGRVRSYFKKRRMKKEKKKKKEKSSQKMVNRTVRSRGLAAALEAIDGPKPMKKKKKKKMKRRK